MSTARVIFLAVAIAAFVGLGVIGLLQHDWRTGVASLMLAAVNGLLLA